MGKKRWLTIGLGCLFVCTLAMPQSLVELAKKEKERREKLKDQKSIVLTNADLKKVLLKSALTVSPPPSDASGVQTEAAPRPAAGSNSPIKVTVSEKSSPPQDDPAADEKEELKEAEEIMAMLTLKMQGLWKKYYSMNDMTSRDSIQQQISETFQQLQEVQGKVAELRKKLNLPPLEEQEQSIIFR